jgi:LemA protein
MVDLGPLVPVLFGAALLVVLIEAFPSNLVAKAFGFGKEEYFEVEDPAVRAAPAVDFS